MLVKSRRLLPLALLVLFLALLLVVPVMGMAAISHDSAAVQSGQSDVAFEQPAVELACVPGDPGSSGGGSGGC